MKVNHQKVLKVGKCRNCKGSLACRHYTLTYEISGTLIMEKKSHSTKRDPSVKEVMKQQLLESTQRPNKEKVVSVEQPNVGAPPPPHFCVHLCFPKALSPTPVTSNDYFKNLGFVGGYDTLVYVSHKKAKFPGKSLYALGRSWFKEGATVKDKCVSTDMHKKEKCHRSDDDEAKGYLKEFLEQAKAAKVLARKKGKMVQRQVLSTSGPHCGKKKFVPKMRSLNDILMAIDQECDN